MADDVQKFVTSCSTCQRMKSSKQKKAGLLQPLPIPEQPWQVVTLDFITGLPTTTSGHDAILVVIDMFSKMGHFIPTYTTARTEETAQLFLRYIISQHDLPTTLISDRDPKFTSKFWKELMSLLGTKLAMSSAYHPQTDGQTAPQPNCGATPPRSLQGRHLQMGLAPAHSGVSLQQCHSHRYGSDAVLPLLRRPPTHTTETDNIGNSPTGT
ncbi:hypothetical protein CLOM_g13518 [Closterium sp. NIES-68]|nr:hypothetical protein CLOM_g13518 [Closterium sp. NIES-68]